MRFPGDIMVENPGSVNGEIFFFFIFVVSQSLRSKPIEGGCMCHPSINLAKKFN